MIQVKNLTYSYQKKGEPIIKDATFDVVQGKVNVLLGPNGVGKSTLIKCIDRILDFKQGEITINDKNVKEYKRNDLAKLVSYVSQEAKVEYLNVFECIMLGRIPYIQYFSKEKDEAIVTELIKTFGIEHLASRSFSTLSGGEKQIVMLLRCVAQDAQVILLDEPTANLDIKNSLMVLKFIKELVEKKGLTILISMHDISLAHMIADRYILLKNTQVLAQIDKNQLTTNLLSETFGVDFLIESENVILNMEGGFQK